MMHLFTETEAQQLQQALTLVKDVQQRCNLEQLHGFMVGLVLSPESITPAEWVPYIFQDALEDANKGQQQRAALASIHSTMQSMHAQHQAKPITYPFHYTQPTGIQIKQMIEWCAGLRAALILRSPLWLGDHIKNKTEEQTQNFQEVAFCFTSLHAITTPSDIPTLFSNTPQEAENMNDDEQLRLFVKCLQGMPHLMQSLAKFSADYHSQEDKDTLH